MGGWDGIGVLVLLSSMWNRHHTKHRFRDVVCPVGWLDLSGMNESIHPSIHQPPVSVGLFDSPFYSYKGYLQQQAYELERLHLRSFAAIVNKIEITSNTINKIIQ